jgi:hypothetical protein
VALIEVDLDRALYEEKGDGIGNAVHQAQIDAFDLSPDDVYQVFRPHDDTRELRFHPSFGGRDRRGLTLIRVTVIHKHPGTVKKKFYKAVAENLEAIGIRREDVLIALIENGFEDWFADLPHHL